MEGTKIITTELCRDLVVDLKKTKDMRGVSEYCDRSVQTIRQYMANPDSTSCLQAPVKVTDALINLLISVEVVKPDLLPWQTKDGKGWTAWYPQLTPFICRSYLVALEVADRFGDTPKRIDGSATDTVDSLCIDHAATLRHFWRKVFFGGRVPRQELADLSATDICNVAWVGREHPTRGIQPTHEQVMYAMATDAAWATQECSA